MYHQQHPESQSNGHEDYAEHHDDKEQENVSIFVVVMRDMDEVIKRLTFIIKIFYNAGQQKNVSREDIEVVQKSLHKLYYDAFVHIYNHIYDYENELRVFDYAVKQKSDELKRKIDSTWDMIAYFNELENLDQLQKDLTAARCYAIWIKNRWRTMATTDELVKC